MKAGKSAHAVDLSKFNRPAQATGLAAQLDKMQSLSEAFPDVDPGIKPFGSRVLVQIRSPKSKTIGGIILPGEIKDSEKWNQQVGRVHALGPVAFRDRKTLAEWPETAWAQPGMYVRMSKYSPDRWEVPIGENGDTALFVVCNDLDLIGEVTCDPRLIKAFV